MTVTTTFSAPRTWQTPPRNQKAGRAAEPRGRRRPVVLYARLLVCLWAGLLLMSGVQGCRSSGSAMQSPAGSPWPYGPGERPRFYILYLPEVQNGKANITALYAAKFGAPAVGQKVFIRSKQMESGYEDLPHQWSGTVPASS